MTGTVGHLPEHPGRTARCPFARVFSAVGVSLAMFVSNVPTVMAGHDLIPDRGSQAAPRSLPGSDHFVTPTGAGAQDGTSWQNASSSIESMLNALDPGDTLWIGGGTYSIPREISIQRSGAIGQPLTISTSSDPTYGGPVTLQGANNGYDSMVLLDVDGSHWVIRGESQTNRLTFTSLYLDPGPQHSRGLLMLEGDDFLLENTAFHYPDYQADNSWQHCRQSAITTGRRDWYAGENTSNVEIRYSTFYNLGFGSQDTGRGGALYASNTHNLSFHNNEVYSTFNGIQFEGTNSSWQIFDNVFHDNWNAGISAEQQGASGTGVTSVRIYDNTFYDNYVEAIATWCACGGNASLGWEVFNNLFYRTGDAFSDSQAFFLLTGISDSLFYNNVIIDPFTARWGGTGQAFYITDNTCGCSENRNNRFLNNTFVNRQHYGSVEFLRIWQSAGRASGNLADSNLLFVGDGSQNSFLNEGSNTFTNNPYFSDADNPFVDVQHPPSASNRAAAGLMLAPGCRAIDAGSDHSSLFSTDFLGRERDSAFDVGAYERLPIFADVPFDHPLNREIEALYVAGYTAGCNTDPLLYCPNATMNRAESSVFVERGIHTATYDPPAPSSQVFADMPLDSWAAKWVNGLWQDQYTAGCGTDPLIYCPWQGHTRAEGCVFYLRMLNGSTYEPPQPSQQTFTDVSLDAWYARWVHAAYAAGLIPSCQTTPEVRFCPDDPLTRSLAAYMMVQAKGLLGP